MVFEIQAFEFIYFSAVCDNSVTTNPEQSRFVNFEMF
jgi:hypothetical protein